jgi:hypothetical protein
MIACTDSGSLIYPDAEELRQVDSSTALLYEAPGADNSCPTSLTTYGTDDAVGEVIEFYEERGFQSRTPSMILPSVRWMAHRDGAEQSWRHVDISAGEIAGHPQWETVFELASPACHG